MFTFRFLHADFSDTDRLIWFFRALASGREDVPGFGLGELIYNLFRNCSPPLHESVGICSDASGDIAALCWLEPENECAFLVHPSYRNHPDEAALHAALLEFAVSNLNRITPVLANPIGLTIDRNDKHDAKILTSLGLRTDGEIQHLTFRATAKDSIAPPALPAGFRFTDMSDESLLDERVALVKSVWPEHTLDVERYRSVRTAPIYRADLDLAIADSEDRLLAFATCWFDPVTNVGQLEPVGTHPDARGKGLGKAIVQHASHRLFDLGAERVFINCFAKNDAGRALYFASGYELAAEWQWWYIQTGANT
jgi:GNAT superfamily N-acetyltransferase